MTSNTAPYGKVSASNETNNTKAYKAFNNANTEDFDRWTTSIASTGWIQYEFTNPICISKIGLQSLPKLSVDTGGVSPVDATAKIQVSNDNFVTDIHDLQEVISVPTSDALTYKVHNVTCNGYYKYVRFVWISNNMVYNNSPYCGITTLQFYGRQLNVSVPKMTSNTAPWGEAFADEYHDDTTVPYKAFDNDDSSWWTSTSQKQNSYVGYDFKKPVLIKKVCLKQNENAGNTVRVEYSDDKNVWTSADCIFNTIAKTIVFSDVNEKKLHRYWRFFFAVNNNYTSTIMANFYGLDYSEREFEEGSTMKYIYDHGVEFEEIYTQPIVTKKDNYVTIAGTSSAVARYVLKDGLNLANYKILRAKISGYTGAYGNSHLIVIKISTGETTSYGGVTNDNVPNNCNLDVSNINDLESVGFQSVNGSSITFNELWLE